MTYRQAVDYLFHRERRAMRFGLDAIRDLLGRCGGPQKSFASVHVAGTNGKGSSTAMLEAVLRAAGYRTGRYTSPHLTDMRERIAVSGRNIPGAAVSAWLHRHRDDAEAAGATVFEILTAMAFSHFRDSRVDIAVVETGLGGRLDATNAVTPVLTAITAIGKDHTELLGGTIESIAREKAGILKPGVTCVAAPQSGRVRAVLTSSAASVPCPIVFSRDAVSIRNLECTDRFSRFDASTELSEYRGLRLGLIGRHQIDNAALVIAAVDALRKSGWKIPDRAVAAGLRGVVWRGRLEVLRRNPTVLVDSAHNPAGVTTLALALRTLFRYDRLILVFGVLADKDYRSMLKILAPAAHHLILTRPLSERAMDPALLAGLPALKGKTVTVIPDIRHAWKTALASARHGDLVCGAGSIYFAGEVLKLPVCKR
ncbi:MAG: folylpolyglutamate synthase/dihydrofolate synthase family protein [bacterium]|nr:folylpolyglutamate synthase/dihydrofolate synthase family protein [bacterium]